MLESSFIFIFTNKPLLSYIVRCVKEAKRKNDQ